MTKYVQLKPTTKKLPDKLANYVGRKLEVYRETLYVKDVISGIDLSNWFPNRFEPYCDPTLVKGGYLIHSSNGASLLFYKELTSLNADIPFYNEILLGWISWLRKS